MAIGIKRRRLRKTAELNVTTFMNLMVVLIPFLLLNAVFVQLSVFTIQVPESSEHTSRQEEDAEALRLTLTLRQQGYELHAWPSNQHYAFPSMQQDGFQPQALQDTLLQFKKEYPKAEAITLLSEPHIAYEELVATMDLVRAIPQEHGPQTLFPQISIGAAPPVAQEATHGQ